MEGMNSMPDHSHPISDPPVRAAAYIRAAGAASIGDPAVQRQRDLVMRAADELGWPAPDLYADVGSPDWTRPGSDLAILASRIQAGDYDAVIIENLARISRATAEVAAFYDLCANRGITVCTLDDGPVSDGIMRISTGLT
jgi:DNA invertase Pin-like site-specific DNA recombinase